MKYINKYSEFLTESIKYFGKLTDKEIDWLERRGRASYSGGPLRPIIIDNKMVGGISWNLGGIDYIEFLPKYRNRGYLKQVVKDNIERGQVKFVTASDDLQAKLSNYGEISNDPNTDITTVKIKKKWSI